MPRLELPNDGWAELRDPDQIPRKHAKRYRSVYYRALVPGVGAGSNEEAGGAIMASYEGVEDAVDALVLGVVSSWSYGQVDQETLEGLPDAVVQAINGRLVEDDYITKLMPDFSPSPDEDSPTGPSST